MGLEQISRRAPPLTNQRRQHNPAVNAAPSGLLGRGGGVIENLANTFGRLRQVLAAGRNVILIATDEAREIAPQGCGIDAAGRQHHGRVDIFRQREQQVV